MSDCPETLAKEVSSRFSEVSRQSIIDGPHGTYLVSITLVISYHINNSLSELDLKSLVKVEVEGFNLVHWGFRRLKVTSGCNAGAVGRFLKVKGMHLFKPKYGGAWHSCSSLGRLVTDRTFGSTDKQLPPLHSG